MTAAVLLAHVVSRTSLGVIAVTDHDDLAGAIDAWDRARDLPGATPRVIVGTEVTAAWGKHVVALFPSAPFPAKPLPRFRSVRDTVALIHDLGGIAVAPHPATPLVPSLGEGDIRRLMDGTARLDAIEVCTGALRGRRREARMRRLARELGIAEVGSSDAHHLAHVGAAVTHFDGAGIADLVAAITGRTTVAGWGQSTRVGPRALLAQAGRAWAVRPARELREVMRHPRFRERLRRLASGN